MLGQFVTSKAGHDQGRLYVIVAEDEKYSYLSDGSLKNPANPKKKKRKHIQPINAYVEDSLQKKLSDGENVMPEAIRLAIKKYRNQKNAEK